MAWDSDIVAHDWQVGDSLPSHNDGCMICGSRSLNSPLLSPWQVLEAEQVGARVRFDDRHQGAPAYAHGGAVAAVLDDAMGYVSFLVLRIFVTAHLEIDYVRPVLLGAEHEVRARCDRIDGRKVYLAADLLREGEVVARSTGMFVVVDIEHFQP